VLISAPAPAPGSNDYFCGRPAGLVYVTGISGAGKSTVCAELRRRGYDAHDSDEDGNAVWVDRSTGEVVGRVDSSSRTHAFLERYEWRFNVLRVSALAERGNDRPVFLCGAAANEAQVWPLFRRVIYLAIDDDTLCHRLATRTTNDFGRSSYERDLALGWHHVTEDNYRRYGAAIIDGTLPAAEVVDDVLRIALDT